MTIAARLSSVFAAMQATPGSNRPGKRGVTAEAARGVDAPAASVTVRAVRVPLQVGMSA